MASTNDSNTPPDAFVCPITHEVMKDPVVATDGHTYERKAMKEWLTRHDTSPMTGVTLPSEVVVPNHNLRSQIRRSKENSSTDDSDTAPEEYECPITSNVMDDPVVASDGYTYESKAIEGWLNGNNTSPVTGVTLSSDALVPNHNLRSQIRESPYGGQKAREEDLKEENLHLQILYKGQRHRISDVEHTLSGIPTLLSSITNYIDGLQLPDSHRHKILGDMGKLRLEIDKITRRI